MGEIREVPRPKIEKVTGTPKKLEAATPEANALENFSNLFYRLSKVTSGSHIRGTETDRPFSLRAKRAEMYKQVIDARLDGDTGEAKRLIAEARQRDEIAQQYLTQAEVTIDIQGLGSQTARYTEVRPPEGLDKGLPTIYLVPGISNDLDCVGWLMQELAMQGRSVISVGFPESFMGKTTEEFAKAVKDSKGYGPHAQFFDAALTALTPTEGKFVSDKGEQVPFNDHQIELWGFSTGAPIVAEMLQDPSLQRIVTDAVLLSPASTADQGAMSLNAGVMKEAAYLASELGSLPKYTFSTGRKELEDIAEEEPEQRKIKKGIYKTLLERVRTKMDGWKTARVREGGSITIVSGDKDSMTKSYKEMNDADKVSSENPQARLLRISDGHHSTPLIHPETVLPQIFSAQKP